MKQSTLFRITLLLGIIYFTSCSNKSQVTIYDGELQWPAISAANIMSGTDNAGDVSLWAPHFQTEIGNSLRGLSFMINTCEPGVYSGVYDATSEKWSTDAILFVTLNVDYDGVPYPTWRGQSATITIHSYDKRAKRIDATLEAVMLMDGSTNTRTIRVDMQNMTVVGQ